MKKWILSIILNSLALLLVAELFDAFQLEGWGTAILASFILSILNVIVRPILVVLTLPITIISLGLFLFVINAITLMIAQGLLGDSFIIDGFGMAIVAAILLSLLQLVINQMTKDK